MPSLQQDTAELITRYYGLFNEGDRDGLLALLTEDVRHDINQGGTEVGVDAFRAFLGKMDRCYKEQVEQLQVFANEDGTRAAAEFYIRGEYLQSDEGLPPAQGQKYWLRVGAFFDVIDGKVDRVTNYYNLSDWLLQVGA